MSAARRPLLIALAVVIAWYVAVIVLWAVRPLEDSIPTGTGADGRPAAETVECNTLFDSSSRDRSQPLPVPPAPEQYTRGACGLVHRDAQRVFVFDTIAVVVIAGGIVALLIRDRRHPEPPEPSSVPPSMAGVH